LEGQKKGLTHKATSKVEKGGGKRGKKWAAQKKVHGRGKIQIPYQSMGGRGGGVSNLFYTKERRREKSRRKEK